MWLIIFHVLLILIVVNSGTKQEIAVMIKEINLVEFENAYDIIKSLQRR